MEDIKMVDTKAQYAQLKPQLDAAFNAVMENMQLIDGPQVASFAGKLEQYVQVSHAFPCANGTIALQLALRALALPAGAEVILPAFSYAAGAEVVQQLGLKPVFADVLPDTFTLDPSAVEKAVSQNTAAIIPVHLFGQCAQINPILELAERHKLWLVEDNTQSLGAAYEETGKQALKAGSIGHISITSFFPAKPLGGTGEGGAVLTRDAVLAERLEQLLKPKATATDTTGIVNSGVGLDTLQAAMLEVKITQIDVFNKRRAEVAQFYDRVFSETSLVQAPYRASYSTHVYQQYAIGVAPELRDGLQHYLRDNHIPSVVYYPEPLHLQESFAYLNYKPGDFPISEKLSGSVLSLPMHTELKQDQLEYICHHILAYVNGNA